jgi:hypothetical protein
VLVILVATVAWVPAVLGLGSLLRYSGDVALRRAVTGVLGLAVLAAAGMVVHLATPLTPAVSAVAWVAGVVLFVCRFRWIVEGVTRVELAGAVAVLAGCVLIMQPPTRPYDAGLYYFQTMQWLTERRIEIGLVNIHFRLAIIYAWFVVAAILEHPLMPALSQYVASTLLIVFGATAVMVGMERVLRGDRSFSTVAMLMLALPVAHATENVGTLAPDVVGEIVIPFTLVLWIRALADDRSFAGEARAATLFSVFAVLAKLSTAPLAAGTLALLLFGRRKLSRRWVVRTAALVSGEPCCRGDRSVLLSGCVAYPAALTCIDALRWTPSHDNAGAHRQDHLRVGSTARRRSDVVLSSWACCCRRGRQRPWRSGCGARCSRSWVLRAVAWLVVVRSTTRVLTSVMAISLAGAALLVHHRARPALCYRVSFRGGCASDRVRCDSHSAATDAGRTDRTRRPGDDRRLPLHLRSGRFHWLGVLADATARAAHPTLRPRRSRRLDGTDAHPIRIRCTGPDLRRPVLGRPAALRSDVRPGRRTGLGDRAGRAAR